MTAEETIYRLESMKGMQAIIMIDSRNSDLVKKDAEETFDTLKTAQDALHKQIPKKIVRKRKEDQYTGKCPNCGTDLMYIESSGDAAWGVVLEENWLVPRNRYCHICGTKIDWSE